MPSVIASFAACIALVLVSVNVAAAQNDTGGAISYDQQCIVDCEIAASIASGCHASDNACVCTSAIHISNVTQCATGTCGLSEHSAKVGMDQACASVPGYPPASGIPGSTISITPSNVSSLTSTLSSVPSTISISTESGSTPAPSESGKPNSAQFVGVQAGLASGLAAALIFYAHHFQI
ncbi:hypothetical protein C8R43DRAFT_1116781 [Mycena crocata]|nr:hypothetical protein C8R43DRAFT_1116781 [Mycena crocata]